MLYFIYFAFLLLTISSSMHDATRPLVKDYRSYKSFLSNLSSKLITKPPPKAYDLYITYGYFYYQEAIEKKVNCGYWVEDSSRIYLWVKLSLQLAMFRLEQVPKNWNTLVCNRKDHVKNYYQFFRLFRPKLELKEIDSNLPSSMHYIFHIWSAHPSFPGLRSTGFMNFVRNYCIYSRQPLIYNSGQIEELFLMFRIDPEHSELSGVFRLRSTERKLELYFMLEEKLKAQIPSMLFRVYYSAVFQAIHLLGLGDSVGELDDIKLEIFTIYFFFLAHFLYLEEYPAKHGNQFFYILKGNNSYLENYSINFSFFLPFFSLFCCRLSRYL